MTATTPAASRSLDDSPLDRDDPRMISHAATVCCMNIILWPMRQAAEEFADGFGD